MIWLALRRLDAALWVLRPGVVEVYSDPPGDGPRATRVYPSGSRVRLHSHFPGWAWRFAARSSNRLLRWGLR